MNIHHQVRALTCVVGILLPSCAPDEPVFGARAWSGEHVEVWTTEDAVVCGGSFAALEHHAEAVSAWAEEHGVGTTSERFRYYWGTPDEIFDAGPCRNPSGICFVRRFDAIYTYQFTTHELVHAEFAAGHSSFADEGMATLLGGIRITQVPDGVDIPRLLDSTAGGQLPGNDYEVAAKFLRATAELDPEGFAGAAMRTRRSDDFEAYDARLAIDARDAVEFDASFQACWFDAVRIPLSECSATPIPWSTNERWENSGIVDCGNASTIGPGRDDAIWVTIPFDVTESGRYTARFDGDAFVRLLRCDAEFCGSGDTGEVDGFGTWLASGYDIPRELVAGRYWFDVRRELGDDHSGEFSLSVVRGWPE